MKYQSGRPRELNLQLPTECRDIEAEKLIVISLHDFFAAQYHHHIEKCRSKLTKGILLLISGMVLMFVNAWISYTNSPSLPVVALKVILEPGGWFLIWAAFDFLLYDFPDLKRERAFFQELDDMKIHFRAS